MRSTPAATLGRRMVPRSPRTRRWLLVAAAALVVIAAGAVVAALTLGKTPGNVSNPNVEFSTAEPAPPPPPKPPKPAKRAEDPHDRFVWPVYGYTSDRRRHLAGATLPPPYAWLWTRR